MNDKEFEANERRAKDEIKVKFFRVYFEFPTSWGYDKSAVKYFRKYKSALAYAKSLLPELKEDAKISDDDTMIKIENEKGEDIKTWRVEEGEVEEI